MPQPYRRHTCACLALCTLGSLTALADPPAAPATSVVQPTAQRIVLQNVLPGDIIKTLHWDQAAHLPVGVTQILPLPTQNALAVTATPDGFAKVRQIVATLDMVQRQVQVALATAHASDIDLKAAGLDLKDTVTDRYATGPAVARFFHVLTTRSVVIPEPVITTTSGVEASLSFSSGAGVPSTSTVVPYADSNNFVTLVVHPAFSDGGVERKINFRRTVKSGNMVVYVLPSTVPGGDHLLFFATPIIK